MTEYTICIVGNNGCQAGLNKTWQKLIEYFNLHDDRILTFREYISPAQHFSPTGIVGCMGFQGPYDPNYRSPMEKLDLTKASQEFKGYQKSTFYLAGLLPDRDDVPYLASLLPDHNCYLVLYNKEKILSIVHHLHDLSQFGQFKCREHWQREHKIMQEKPDVYYLPVKEDGSLLYYLLTWIHQYVPNLKAPIASKPEYDGLPFETHIDYINHEYEKQEKRRKEFEAWEKKYEVAYGIILAPGKCQITREEGICVIASYRDEANDPVYDESHQTRISLNYLNKLAAEMKP